MDSYMNYREGLVNTVRDEKIPKNINLTTVDGYSFLEETTIMVGECLDNTKKNEFYCNTVEKKTTYLDCLSCPFNDNCKHFEGLEEKIDLYEFFLDNTTED